MPHHPVLTGDRASEWLGITVERADPGHSVITMPVREEMLNGFGIVHGGMIFALADSCFAMTCNDPASDGSTITVAQGVDINFLSSGHAGQTLVAEGRQIATTGQPTVVAYTEDDLQTWGTLVARCFRRSGVKPGDKVHTAYGYGLFTGGLGAHYGAERLGCAVIPMSGGQTEKQGQLIRDFEPQAILATPTYLLTIADGFRKLGPDPRETSLEHAVLGAEPWTEEMRHEIGKTFDITACGIYGLSEVMGPGVAGESYESKDGSHIWEDHFRPEIIDPFDDTVLPVGRPGELVFTALTKQALPTIRYRTHDLTRLLPGTARPGHRRMSRITGRSDDMIILRGVNLFPSQIEELALQIPTLSPHFTIEITRPNRMDQMTIHIERREEATLEQAQGVARSCCTTSRRRSVRAPRPTSSNPAPWHVPRASCAASTTTATSRPLRGDACGRRRGDGRGVPPPAVSGDGAGWRGRAVVLQPGTVRCPEVRQRPAWCRRPGSRAPATSPDSRPTPPRHLPGGEKATTG
ncbi:phenylacetic acid degradation protein PaaD [Kocuria marina]